MPGILLMAAQIGRTRKNRAEAARRMGALHDAVTRRGYAMLYLASDTDGAAVEDVERERRGIVLRIRAPRERDAYYLRWPKDGIQSYTRFVAIADSPVTRRLARSLGIADAVISPLCEGGLFLRSAETLVRSSAARMSLRDIQPHYQVETLPHPYTAIAYRRQYPPNALGGKSHIDLDCTLVPTGTRRPLLLVGDLYYRTYESAVCSVAGRIGALVYVVPAKEVDRRVLNLIVLPPHNVIIPSGCPLTRKLLEKHLGREHVITIRIDEHFDYNGGIGGLGCMSSIIDPSHCGRKSATNTAVSRAG